MGRLFRLGQEIDRRLAGPQGEPVRRSVDFRLRIFVVAVVVIVAVLIVTVVAIAVAFVT